MILQFLLRLLHFIIVTRRHVRVLTVSWHVRSRYINIFKNLNKDMYIYKYTLIRTYICMGIRIGSHTYICAHTYVYIFTCFIQHRFEKLYPQCAYIFNHICTALIPMCISIIIIFIIRHMSFNKCNYELFTHFLPVITVYEIFISDRCEWCLCNDGVWNIDKRLSSE
jgi:hypothetical protein